MVRPLEEKKHFKKTDIKKLVDTLKGELTDSVQTAPKSTQELDQQVGALVAALTKAIDASTPMLQVSPRSIPGFDKECKEAQMRARRLKKKFKKEPSPELWEEYKQARAFKGSLISKKKREAYKEYCSKVCESPKTMWKACNIARQTSTRHVYLPALRRPDDTLADDPKEKLEILKEKFFPQSPSAKLDDIENYTYPEALETPPITDRDIVTAISLSGSDKAPGSAGIPNRILKYIGHLITPDLNRIFNSSLHLGYYPRHFRDSITMVLRKPAGQEQKDYSLPKSYRPIALFNTISKILESANRISYPYLPTTPPKCQSIPRLPLSPNYPTKVSIYTPTTPVGVVGR